MSRTLLASICVSVIAETLARMPKRYNSIVKPTSVLRNIIENAIYIIYMYVYIIYIIYIYIYIYIIYYIYYIHIHIYYILYTLYTHIYILYIIYTSKCTCPVVQSVGRIAKCIMSLKLFNTSLRSLSLYAYRFLCLPIIFCHLVSYAYLYSLL